MQFLQNTWYASASIDEVTVRALLKHTIINQPLVIFSTARSLVTLEDRCLHRFSPLSIGQITENVIRHGYHGLEFGESGRCVSNPHGRVLESARRAAPAGRHAKWESTPGTPTL
jgi:phenylpropionate dioxygenase-like ring-hydroxylating dioxygenase large terminal subunit